MDTEHWKILITAIEKGSLSAASEALDYTVSGVSRSIAAAEKELGFQLLYRSKQGVVPTPACSRLLPFIRELLFAQEKIDQTAAEITGYKQGTIGIGTAYRYYYQWISELTSDFHSMYPGIQFRIIDGTSTELIRLLQLHQLDFCIVSEREGSHCRLSLCRDPMMAIVPVDYFPPKQTAVSLDDLLPKPYIQTCPGQDTDSMHFFEHRAAIPNTQFSTMDIQATYAVVGAGLGYSISNHLNCNTDDTSVRHLKLDPPELIEIDLAYNREQPPAAAEFLKFIKAALCGKTPIS